MIKDEYERYTRALKAPVGGSGARNAKSSQRNDMKSEQALKHLSGIYGSVTGGTQLSNRKDPNKSIKTTSMTREETTTSKFTNVLNKHNRIKNVKSLLRDNPTTSTHQHDSHIKITKKNTQLPIADYQNAIEVNSSLSNVGLTSGEEEDLTPALPHKLKHLALQNDNDDHEYDDGDLNDRNHELWLPWYAPRSPMPNNLDLY